MTPIEETNTIISGVQSKLPEDPTFKEFSNLYLRSIPTRSLREFNQEELIKFVQARFEFLKSAKLTDITITFSTVEKTSNTCIEIATPDAMFLLVTIENVIQTFSLEILKLFHPTLEVLSNKKGSITSVQKATTDKPLMSLSYIELDKQLTEDQLSKLGKELREKILAVNLAQSSHEKMIQRLMDVKTLVDQQELERQEFHQEWVDLLEWLKNYNYSFFGSCIYTHKIKEKKHSVSLKKSSGLGILSEEYKKENGSVLEEELETHVNRLKDYRSPFLFDTIHFISPIQRFENLMRLSLKIPVSKTETVEYIFLGLLKRSSLMVKNLETPIIRKKMDKIFKAKHMLPGSYDFNQTIRLFTATPKFELFRTPTEHLLRMIDDLLSITNLNEVYCFTRPQIDTTKEFLMIVIPPKLFSRENVDAVFTFLEDDMNIPIYEVIRVRGDVQCRLHIHIDVSETPVQIDTQAIEQGLRTLIKPWNDRLENSLIRTHGLTKGKALLNDYMDKFPHHHKVRRTPEETLRDIESLERLRQEDKIQFNLVPFIFKDSVLYGTASILFIYNKHKIDLIKMMSTLQNLGIHVFDEITTRIGSRDEVVAYIHQFRICHLDQTKMDEEAYKGTLLPLLSQVFSGHAANDELNAFAVKAKFSWKQIMILQLYREFLSQIETPHPKDKMNAALLKHVNSTTALVNYFEDKFNPDLTVSSLSERKDTYLKKHEQSFIDSLESVTSISEDLILRQFFSVIKHTLRTNYFMDKPDTEPTLSIKLDSKNITMPQPVPYREIFVYDCELEGTHLRFGPVARGGLRWSNRHKDFRREILGLVKTQQTKNVVIVPVGSKGGFVIKKDITADNAASESKKQYQKFIRALLDITDTINADDRVNHPNRVVDYDGEDPYLVVAADKGTATFSDHANDISEEYKFWLGDAFASGGSVGYNHKEVGITAKGAWECVKLHFLEQNKDIQKEEFTVCGIGDMSGDVFGNGMLLSKYIKLQAAFNHIHIFIDPDPDPKKSYKERERLFELPRSTWKDYKEKLISKGGGVFDRKAKEIILSPEIKALLGVTKDKMNGEELITAILKMKVDLLWFGGIGTYIKSPNQTHYDVGDPANDNVRIDSTDCHAAVIGEGANLGMTQVSRLELSNRNIRVNTDFIDNSAGVNMSDYEVNIKILLKKLLEEKKISSMAERNKLLADATDQVTDLVLDNNQGQHQLISMDQLRSKSQFNIFNKLINDFIDSKALDPITENIPPQIELDRYADSGAPLPRPLLAVLQSYVKMDVFDKLVNSPILEESFVDTLYQSYFPELILSKFSDQINSHRLKKEIEATLITNKIVNQAGICFFFQTTTTTGKPVDRITEVYLTLERLLDIDSIRDHIYGSSMPYSEKYNTLLSLENTFQQMVTNILHLPTFPSIEELESNIKTIGKLLGEEVSTDKRELKTLQTKLTKLQMPKTIIKKFVYVKALVNLNELIQLNQLDGVKLENSLRLLTDINTIFSFDWLVQKIESVSVKTQWEVSQKDILLQTIHIQKFNVIRFLVGQESLSLKDIRKSDIETFLEKAFPAPLSMYFNTLKQLKAASSVDLTSLTVVINRLNFVTFS